MSHYEVLETEDEGRQCCNSDRGEAEVTIATFTLRPRGFKTE